MAWHWFQDSSKITDQQPWHNRAIWLQSIRFVALHSVLFSSLQCNASSSSLSKFKPYLASLLSLPVTLQVCKIATYWDHLHTNKVQEGHGSFCVKKKQALGSAQEASQSVPTMLTTGSPTVMDFNSCPDIKFQCLTAPSMEAVYTCADQQDIRMITLQEPAPAGDNSTGIG